MLILKNGLEIQVFLCFPYSGVDAAAKKNVIQYRGNEICWSQIISAISNSWKKL